MELNDMAHFRRNFIKVFLLIIKVTASLFAILFASLFLVVFFCIDPLYEYLGTELKKVTTFDGDGLVVTNFTGFIKIIEDDRCDKISIKAEGPEDYLENLKIDGVNKKGEYIYIRHINPDSSILKGINLNSTLITIHIPVKAILRLEATPEKVEITEKTGDVKVNVNSSASVDIKSLAGTFNVRIK